MSVSRCAAIELPLKVPLKRPREVIRTSLGVSAGVSERLEVGDAEILRNLEFDKHDLARAVKRKDVEAVAVLFELGELVAQHEKLLTNEIGVGDDPLLERQFIDSPLERDRFERGRCSVGDQQETWRESFTNSTSTGIRAARPDRSGVTIASGRGAELLDRLRASPAPRSSVRVVAMQ